MKALKPLNRGNVINASDLKAQQRAINAEIDAELARQLALVREALHTPPQKVSAVSTTVASHVDGSYDIGLEDQNFQPPIRAYGHGATEKAAMAQAVSAYESQVKSRRAVS